MRHDIPAGRGIAGADGRDISLKGAFHSSDLWYVFKSLKHCWRPMTPGDWQLAEVELTAWTNFAKFGNPKPHDGSVSVIRTVVKGRQ